MGRTAARTILALVIVLWTVMLWSLNSAADPDVDPVEARTHCVTTVLDQEVCTADDDEHGDESESPTRRTTTRPPTTATPSGSRTASPSGTAPSGSASPTPTGSPTTTQTFDSRITIRYRNGRFFGIVSSDSEQCESRRDVNLKKKRTRGSVTVAADGTDRSGAWTIRYPRAKGRFFAAVTAKRIQTETGTIHCRAARSRTISP